MKRQERGRRPGLGRVHRRGPKEGASIRCRGMRRWATRFDRDRQSPTGRQPAHNRLGSSGPPKAPPPCRTGSATSPGWGAAGGHTRCPVGLPPAWTGRPARGRV